MIKDNNLHIIYLKVCSKAQIWIMWEEKRVNVGRYKMYNTIVLRQCEKG